MIGGGIAGIYAGAVGLVRYAFVSPGLAALPAFIGENPMNIVHAIVTCLIAFVTTFVLTLVIGFDDPVEEEGLKEDELAQTETEVAVDYNHEIIIKSPLKGKVVPLSEVNDDVFQMKS